MLIFKIYLKLFGSNIYTKLWKYDNANKVILDEGLKISINLILNIDMILSISLILAIGLMIITFEVNENYDFIELLK